MWTKLNVVRAALSEAGTLRERLERNKDALAVLALLDAEHQRLVAREQVAMTALSAAGVALGARQGESTEDAAKRVVEENKRLAGRDRLATAATAALAEIRDALGAADNEAAVDAAKRLRADSERLEAVRQVIGEMRSSAAVVARGWAERLGEAAWGKP